MVKDARFRINKPKIVLESFEDEMVLVNLDNGYYYSASETGLYILKILEFAPSVNEMIDMLAKTFIASSEELATSLEEFLGQLQSEGIIVPQESSGLETKGQAATIPPANIESKPRKFSKPVLNRYADMRELLLLDPVHEVDEKAGWPQAKDNPAKDQK